MSNVLLLLLFEHNSSIAFLTPTRCDGVDDDGDAAKAGNIITIVLLLFWLLLLGCLRRLLLRRRPFPSTKNSSPPRTVFLFSRRKRRFLGRTSSSSSSYPPKSSSFAKENRIVERAPQSIKRRRSRSISRSISSSRISEIRSSSSSSSDSSSGESRLRRPERLSRSPTSLPLLLSSPFRGRRNVFLLASFFFFFGVGGLPALTHDSVDARLPLPSHPCFLLASPPLFLSTTPFQRASRPQLFLTDRERPHKG